MSTDSSYWTNIVLSDGNMDVHITSSSQAPVRGAIVMLHEIFGVNAAMKEKAVKFAKAGYLVAMPDLFWRTERKVDLSYDEEDRKKGFALMQKFSFPEGVADIVALGKWLDEKQDCKGRVCVVGFCIGGKLAVLAGSQEPFKAAVAMYGVKLDENLDLLQSYPTPLQIHVGDNDGHIPMEVSRKVGDALREVPDAEQFVYAGAQHGFFNAARPDAYDPQASELASKRVMAFLSETLS